MIARVLPHLVADGPRQMALDEAILEAVSDDPKAAVVRTYEWSRPTLSLGYFQSYHEPAEDPLWRDVPIVRRPTGGGAIWHHHDVTYSLCVPRGHELARRADRLYAAVHSAIIGQFGNPDLPAGLRGHGNAPPIQRPFLCFADHDPHDVVIAGVKVVGSAQRRRAGAVLLHGSILLARSEHFPDLIGLSDLGWDRVDATDWAAQLRRAILEALDAEPMESDFDLDVNRRAAVLERERYRGDAWLKRR